MSIEPEEFERTIGKNPSKLQHYSESTSSIVNKKAESRNYEVLASSSYIANKNPKMEKNYIHLKNAKYNNYPLRTPEYKGSKGKKLFDRKPPNFKICNAMGKRIKAIIKAVLLNYNLLHY